MHRQRGFRPMRKFGKKGVFWRWWGSIFLGCCPRHFPSSTYLSQFIKISKLILPDCFLELRSQSTIGPIKLIGQWYFIPQHRDQSSQLGQIIIQVFFRTLRSDENLFSHSCCGVIVAVSSPEGSHEFRTISPLILANLEPQQGFVL